MYLRHYIRRLPRLGASLRFVSDTDASAGLRPDATPIENAREKHRGKVEKLVGYPTPLLSLRHLIGSELTHLSPYFSRLLDSQHPIVRRSRLLLGNPETDHTHGLILLLVSKAINFFNRTLPDLDQFNILPGQRAIAEITELIHTAYIMHQEIVDLPPEGGLPTSNTVSPVATGGDLPLSTVERDGNRLKDYAFGNKLVILGGDKLLARASRELALLFNPQVVECISQAISDLMTGAYLRSAPSTGVDIVSHTPESCLFEYCHNHSSLLANGCLSCALLAELDEPAQSLIANFGRSLSVAQLVRDIKLGDKSEKGCVSDSLLQSLSQEHCNKAASSLSLLPDSEARFMLENIIASLWLH